MVCMYIVHGVQFLIVVLKQWKIAVLWVEARGMPLWYAVALVGLVAISYFQTLCVHGYI